MKLALAYAEAAGSIGLTVNLWQWLVELVGLGYFLAAIRLLVEYPRALEHVYSNLEHKKLYWLLALLSALTLLWAILMVAHGLGVGWAVHVHAILALLMYVLAYIEAAQPELFEPLAPHPNVPLLAVTVGTVPSDQNTTGATPTPGESSRVDGEATVEEPVRSSVSETPEGQQSSAESTLDRALMSEPPSEAERYAKSKLAPEKVEWVAARLEEVFVKDRPYLDPDLDLPTLAALIDATPHQLSQVLNEYIHQTFHDFVNARRVDEVKRRLRDPAFAEEKVLTIGLACGFRSKSTLNANFKKWAGMTPSEWRDLGPVEAS
ncbi:MAG: helix-turn-helix domain-containing protein [Polyangiaceae bacterium]